MSLATIGADLHADPDFGLACTVAVSNEDLVTTTVRAVNSQATDPQQRNRRTDRLTCFLYLLTTAVVRPPRNTVITITADSPYAGVWKTAEAGEPTSHGEWRCAAVRDESTHAIALSAGSPRSPTIP